MERKGSEWMKKEDKGDRRKEMSKQEVKKKRENKRQITVEDIKKFWQSNQFLILERFCSTGKLNYKKQLSHLIKLEAVLYQY